MTPLRLLRTAFCLTPFVFVQACQETPTAPPEIQTPTVSLSVDAQSIDEAGGEAVVRVTFSRALPTATSVTLVLSGTATSDTDYDFSTTVIAIPAGSTTGALSIVAIDDDEDDDDETVVVTIGSVTGGVAVVGSSSAIITIVDDDDGRGHVLFNLTSNRVDLVNRFEVRVLDEVGVEEAFLTVTDSGSGFTALVELSAGEKTFELAAIGSDSELGRCTTQEVVQAGDTLSVTKGVCNEDREEPVEDDEDCQLLNGACNATELRMGEINSIALSGFQALDDDWWRVVYNGVPASGEQVLSVTGSTRSNLAPVAVFRRAPGAATLELLVSLTDNGQFTILSDLVPGTEVYLRFAPVSTIDPCSSDVSYSFSLTER